MSMFFYVLDAADMEDGQLPIKTPNQDLLSLRLR